MTTPIIGPEDHDQLRAEVLTKLFQHNPSRASAIIVLRTWPTNERDPHEDEFQPLIVRYASAGRNGYEASAWAFDRMLTKGEKDKVEALFDGQRFEWIDDPSPYIR